MAMTSAWKIVSACVRKAISEAVSRYCSDHYTHPPVQDDRI